jgi:hypothetical protein
MQGPEIELQNTFFIAEDIKREKPKEALEMYENVILLSESMGDEEVKFRFQSLKNIVVLSARLHLLDKMISNQRLLLKMVSKVAREDLSDAVNEVLDAVAHHLASHPESQSQIYKMTLDILRTNIERLWFTTCLRLAKIYIDQKNYDQLD